MPSKRFLTQEEQDRLRESFNSDLGVKDIAKKLSISYGVIQRYWRKWFSKDEYASRCSRLNRLHKIGSRNHMYGNTGKNHHAYKPTSFCNGYKIVERPEWWVGSVCKSDKVYEHILVCCEKLGLTSLPKGSVVHHIDGSRLNNSPDNLVMMTIGEHMRLHNTTHGKYCKKGAETISTESSS